MADENEVGSAYIKLLPSLSSFAATALSGLSSLIAPVEAGLTGMFSKSAAAAGGLAAEVGAVDPALSGAALGAVGLATAMVGVGVVTGKMASDFQAQMEMLVSQAGIGQDQIKGLSQGVMDLAGNVGFNPTSLAQSLFYVESSFAKTGITGVDALNMVKIAAEGAKVGNADLKDVTTALDAAVTSGIPGVQNMNQAMGYLNATVGEGEMSMQDLTGALSTGVLTVVKQFGVTMQDAGAALAVFGDNNIRGAQAGTDLRMAVQALANPVKQGAGELQKLGITTGELADDMRKGGLNGALQDLVGKMNAAGLTSDQVGQVITEAFGKRAGVGLAVLVGNMTKFDESFQGVQKSATSFSNSWAATQTTTKQKLAESKAALDAIGISIGTLVLPLFNSLASAFIAAAPHIQSLVSGMQKLVNVVSGSSAFKDFVSAVSSPAGIDGIKLMATVIGTLLVTALVRAGVQATISAAKMAAAFLMTQASAIASIGETLVSMGLLVAEWVAAGVSAMASAVVMAAAWIISMGPIALVVAAVIGLAVLIVANWSTIKNFTIEVFDAIWNFIKDHWQMILIAVTGPIGIIVALVVNNWSTIKQVTMDIWNAVVAYISFQINAVLAVIGFLSRIPGDVGSWFRSAYNAVADALGSVVSFVSGIPGKIIGALGNVGSMLYGAGKALIQGMANGIADAAGAVYNAVKNVLSSAKNLIPHSPAKEGPFSGKGWTLYSGQAIMNDLAAGIDSQGANVVKSATNVMANTQKAFGTSAFLAPSLAGSAALGGSSVPTSFANAQLAGISHSTSSSQQISVNSLVLQVNGSMDMTSDTDKRKLLKQIRDGLVTLESSTR